MILFFKKLELMDIRLNFNFSNWDDIVKIIKNSVKYDF